MDQQQQQQQAPVPFEADIVTTNNDNTLSLVTQLCHEFRDTLNKWPAESRLTIAGLTICDALRAVGQDREAGFFSNVPEFYVMVAEACPMESNELWTLCEQHMRDDVENNRTNPRNWDGPPIVGQELSLVAQSFLAELEVVLSENPQTPELAAGVMKEVTAALTPCTDWVQANPTWLWWAVSTHLGHRWCCTCCRAFDYPCSLHAVATPAQISTSVVCATVAEAPNIEESSDLVPQDGVSGQGPHEPRDALEALQSDRSQRRHHPGTVSSLQPYTEYVRVQACNAMEAERRNTSSSTVYVACVRNEYGYSCQGRWDDKNGGLCTQCMSSLARKQLKDFGGFGWTGLRKATKEFMEYLDIPWSEAREYVVALVFYLSDGGDRHTAADMIRRGDIPKLWR
jgi:hypothetical protein